jgi:hypothetical protein
MLYHLLILSFVFLAGSDISTTKPPSVICELRGTVYIEEYPERANFLIYEEDSEAFADMLIYETDNALFATEAGIWYFTDQKGFADFSVYFVESKGNSDFTVYFTSFESLAGCNN